MGLVGPFGLGQGAGQHPLPDRADRLVVGEQPRFVVTHVGLPGRKRAKKKERAGLAGTLLSKRLGVRWRQAAVMTGSLTCWTITSPAPVGAAASTPASTWAAKRAKLSVKSFTSLAAVAS
jgi:hypothetical protein